MNIFSEIERVTAVYTGSPLKEPCRCLHFCMEDTARTGRYCKLEMERSKKAAAPNLKAAHNRAFGALVQQMVEFMQVFDYADCLAALNAADQLCEEKRTADDEFALRTR